MAVKPTFLGDILVAFDTRPVPDMSVNLLVLNFQARSDPRDEFFLADVWRSTGD
jgi:hypothetical protein